MARAHGKQGAVSLPSGQAPLALHVTSWEIVGTTNIADAAIMTTATAQKAINVHAGFTKYTGTVECVAEAATTIPDFADLATSAVSATFTSGGGETYACDVVFSEMRLSNPSDGLVTVSGSFDVDGLVAAAAG